MKTLLSDVESAVRLQYAIRMALIFRGSKFSRIAVLKEFIE